MAEDTAGQEGSDQGRCTRQPVPIAVPSARSPSSQRRADLFTAGIASKNAGDQEGARKFWRRL